MNRLQRRRLLLAAATVPFMRDTWAQQRGRTYRLAVMSNRPSVPAAVLEPIVSGLQKHGWVQGRNLLVDARGFAGDWKEGVEIARALLAARPDVVLALTTSAALAVREVSSTTPIVTWCGYPIEAGLTTSLARPTGNVTGVANYASAEIWGKYLEILRDLRPSLRELAVIWDYLPPAFPDGLSPLAEMKSAAARLGINLHLWMVHEGKDLIEPLSAIERRPLDAILVTCCGGVNNQPAFAKRIADAVAQRRLPAITDLATATFPSAGFVVAYSPHVPTVLDRLAYFIDRVLRGARPSELPFEQPAKFDLVINVKLARAHGISIPHSLLARADRVIE